MLKLLICLLSFSGFAEDVRSYYASTPELVNHGKEIFQSMCISCHGTTGKADTPTGAAIKARNFVDSLAKDWKNGPKVSGVFRTLTKGLPGTAMVAFESLPVKDRFAIAHYIRSAFVTPANQLADSEADFKRIEVEFELFSQEIFYKIPLDKAMKSLAEDFAQTEEKQFSIPDQMMASSILYNNRCASCHGKSGEGYKASFEKINLQSPENSIRPFNNKNAWVSNKSIFVKKAAEGQPGSLKPSNADLSQEQIEGLYNYAKFLATLR